MAQLVFLLDGTIEEPEKKGGGVPVELLPLNEYDHILVSLSSGKDSVACFLELVELGIEICQR